MKRSELAQRYDEWLSVHMTPVRTASGEPARSRGVIQYEQTPILQLALGASISNAADRFRAGDNVPYQVRKAIQELVDAWDMPAILRLRRDQHLEGELRSGMAHHNLFGNSPDGGDLKLWSHRVLGRVNRVYRTDCEPSTPLWRQIHSTMPIANAIRLQRRKTRRAAA